jgi:PPK2 family polyphosphate:nucleotide phosphotransferase
MGKKSAPGRLGKDLIKGLRVKHGEMAELATRPTSGHDAPASQAGHPDLHRFTKELADGQELLYATASKALLIVFQGMDASGKDGSIKHVLSGVNPQGCFVASFKQPSQAELAHDFLWRATARLPARGSIGIFNRSYYEDVVVVRVHPELLGPQHEERSPAELPRLWEQRYQDIRDFEHHLNRSGTQVVKIFLHLSREEQRQRLLARLDDPAKNWKFSPADLAERAYWDQYQAAYEDALSATSTKAAPWYVIPADDKPAARALVAAVIVDAIDRMHLSRPVLPPEKKGDIEAARRQLEAEQAEAAPTP